ADGPPRGHVPPGPVRRRDSRPAPLPGGADRPRRRRASACRGCESGDGRIGSLVPAQAAPLPSQPSPYAVLRNRSFRRIWTAQLVSTIGDALTSLAAGIIVYERTGSVASVGLMLMATAVPTLVVGLIAGVVVDRF